MTLAQELRKRWLFREHAPLRVSLLVLVVGLVALLAQKIVDVFQSGRGWAGLPLEYAVNLPFLLVPVLALYVVMESYSKAVAKAEDELRAVASLPEENPLPVLRLAADGTISYSNPAGRAILQAWGCEVGGLAPQVWGETVREVLAEKSMRVVDLEYGPVFYSFSVAPVPELGYVNLYVSDLTEREMMVRALRESEAKFRSMFESSGVGIGIATPDGRIIEANPAFLSMVGYSEEESRGTMIQDYIHSDDMERAMAERKKMLATGAPNYRFEARFRHKDGHHLWMSQTESSVKDAAGNALYTIAVLDDITSRREAQEALRESEERFRTIFESAAIGIGIVSPEGRNAGFNETFRKMLGYPKEELLNSPILDHIIPDDREKILRARSQLTEGVVREFQGEVRLLTKGGGLVCVNLTASLVRDADGKPLYIATLFEDITARKLAEEQLKQYSTRLEETVKERTRALEEEHDRLLKAESMATVGRISTQVAHDIRNPLAAINTGLFYLKSVVSKEHEKKIDETVRSMEGSVAHANAILQDLLDFSRARQFTSAPVILGPVIVEALSSASLPGGIKVVRKLDPNVRVMGDAPRLLRVFVDLFRNAVDAMPHGGSLTVSCGEEDGRAVIMVWDTGAGIAAANLPKIFIPFFTTKASGLGMGLAICKEVVEAHGGSIKVASTVKGGTTFTISLPLARTT